MIKFGESLENNWYSIIVNGAIHGFFHSTRGCKQGDSLSPALFIIGVEVLPRVMNQLHYHHMYQGFHMAKNEPQKNHLSFADDVIIFSSVTSSSLLLIMNDISKYERVSGKLINNE